MNKTEFLQKLQDSELPTVVDFWAPWCAPCRRTKPILDKLAEAYAGRVNFWALNADEQQELLREMRIMGIPTLVISDGKREIRRVTGAQSPQSYQSLFESLATGQAAVTIPLSTLERFFRLGAGAVLVVLSWQFAAWWLLPVGLIVMFLGIYDRCPIWQAISTYFKRRN